MFYISLYWISTDLLCLLYLSSAYLYITKLDWAKNAILELGYPTYLVKVLIVVKILAPIAIWTRYSLPLSDLAYAGIFYHLVISAIAHIGVKKPKNAIPALIGLSLLAASFLNQNLVRELPSAFAPLANLELISLM